MLNKVQLIGYLGKDPEVRFLPDGTQVANVSLATTEKWRDKNGDKAGAHRVASLRTVREARRDRRRMAEKGFPGVLRRPPRHAQVDRQGRE
jgi:single stranded DNA-binding protein